MIELPLLVCLAFLGSGAPTEKANQISFTSNQIQIEPMEYETLSVVKDFLDAVQQVNFDHAGELLDQDIIWKQPGENRISGLKSSRTEVFEMVEKMYEYSANTITLSQIKVLAVNEDKVACLVHWKGVQPTGAILDVDNIDVYVVKEGKIVEATIFSPNLEQENKFWGK